MEKTSNCLGRSNKIREFLNNNLTKDELYLLECAVIHQRVMLEDFLLNLSSNSERRSVYDAEVAAIKDLQNKLFSYFFVIQI